MQSNFTKLHSFFLKNSVLFENMAPQKMKQSTENQSTCHVIKLGWEKNQSYQYKNIYMYIKTLQFSVCLHLLLNSKTQGCPYKF